MASSFEDNAVLSDITPLTAEQAKVLHEMHPSISPWVVVAWQIVAGCFVAVLAWLYTGKPTAGWSAGYGALAVIIPAVLFTHGLFRQRSAPGPGAMLAGFFVWEMIKVVLTMAMLFAAPRLVPNLNWLALLAGFVVTMKAFWVTIWLRTRRKVFVKKN